MKTCMVSGISHRVRQAKAFHRRLKAFRSVLSLDVEYGVKFGLFLPTALVTAMNRFEENHLWILLHPRRCTGIPESNQQPLVFVLCKFYI
jgi:hypothetical protein